MERYIRQYSLPEIGREGQQKLLARRVAVVGAGGLGIQAAMYLAGAGLGQISIIDFDTVDESNLHRQVIYREADIGQMKSEVLAGHLRALNSGIKITSYGVKLDEGNALDLLRHSDIVLDCTDNLESRYLINDACVILDKAFVSASVYKHQGQLSVFNYKNGPTYRCLYESPFENEALMNCEESGVIGTLPGILGIMMANECFKMVVGAGEILSGKVQLLDVFNLQMDILEFSRNESEVKRIKNQALQSVTKMHNGLKISVESDEIREHLASGKITLIDIRDKNEYPKIESDFLFNKQDPEITEIKSNLPDDHLAVVFCQRGMRSQLYAGQLRKAGMKNVYSLNGGVSSLTGSGLIKNTQRHSYEKK